MIKFSKSKLSKGIKCVDNERGLIAVIEPNIMLSPYDELSIEDLEQILAKMKELKNSDTDDDQNLFEYTNPNL